MRQGGAGLHTGSRIRERWQGLPEASKDPGLGRNSGLSDQEEAWEASGRQWPLGGC